MPIPTWIHTAAAPAVTGWLFQVVTPTFTRCCTHPGDEEAAGCKTPDGSPSGIEDCVWRSPSKSQSTPKAIRTKRRPGASGSLGVVAVEPGVPLRRSCMTRTRFQMSARTAAIPSRNSPWWMRVVRKAETMVGLFVLSESPIPVIGVHCARSPRSIFRGLGVLAPLMLALGLTGCGTSPSPTTGAPSYEIKVGQVAGLGRILVDGSGRTLYLYVPDHRGASVCTRVCAVQSPPLVLPSLVAHPRAGAGVDVKLLGTTRRQDGRLQVTYGGWPLYTWQLDYEPGQATGQGEDMGLWYVVSPSGQPVIR